LKEQVSSSDENEDYKDDESEEEKQDEISNYNNLSYHALKKERDTLYNTLLGTKNFDDLTEEE
jgi:hypothetical protein